MYSESLDCEMMNARSIVIVSSLVHSEERRYDEQDNILKIDRLFNAWTSDTFEGRLAMWDRLLRWPMRPPQMPFFMAVQNHVRLGLSASMVEVDSVHRSLYKFGTWKVNSNTTVTPWMVEPLVRSVRLNFNSTRVPEGLRFYTYDLRVISQGSHPSQGFWFDNRSRENVSLQGGSVIHILDAAYNDPRFRDDIREKSKLSICNYASSSLNYTIASTDGSVYTFSLTYYSLLLFDTFAKQLSIHCIFSNRSLYVFRSDHLSHRSGYVCIGPRGSIRICAKLSDVSALLHTLSRLVTESMVDRWFNRLLPSLRLL